MSAGREPGAEEREPKKGNKEIFIERTEEVLDTKAKLVATTYLFCMTMMTDGLKYKNKEEEIKRTWI